MMVCYLISLIHELRSLFLAHIFILGSVITINSPVFIPTANNSPEGPNATARAAPIGSLDMSPWIMMSNDLHEV